MAHSVINEYAQKYLGKEAAEHAVWLTTMVCDAATKLDGRLEAFGCSRLSLVILAFTLGYILSKIKWWLFDNIETPRVRLRNALFDFVKSLPPVKKYINTELEKAKSKLGDKKKCEDTGDTPEEKRLLSQLSRMPTDGLKSKDIMARLNAYSRVLAKDGEPWKKARLSGGVYHLRQELDDLAVEVFRDQLHANPLHFDVFGDARRCEAELVAWIWRLYNGPENKPPCGAVTSGGTESIVMAVLACRNRALAKGIRWPEIVASTTAHCALEKAAEMFRIRVVKIEPVWPSGEADVAGFKRAINKNTCMLFVSSYSFPWGVIDPVKEISDIGLKYDIPVHCDCCLGGFIVPFAAEAGYNFTHGPVDFRNEGVTTISVDTHKYGFAPKGSSLLLYRDASLRAHQLFVAPDWPGGVYATPGLSGSRSGALVVCAWAAVLQCGFKGYLESTKRILDAAKAIRESIKKTPGIEVLGRGELSVVAWRMSDKSLENCIYLVYDRLTKRGWHINALQNPPALHIAVTDTHTRPGVIEEFVKDLAASTKETLEAVASGKENTKMGTAALYGTTQSIPDRSIVVDFVKQVIEDALAV